MNKTAGRINKCTGYAKCVVVSLQVFFNEVEVSCHVMCDYITPEVSMQTTPVNRCLLYVPHVNFDLFRQLKGNSDLEISN